MASVQEHKDSIQRNEDFFEFLKQDSQFPEWGVVAVFYIAVHYGRALVAHKGLQVRHHGHFKNEFIRIFQDQSCYSNIRMLQDYSESARYDNRLFSWPEVDKFYNTYLEEFKVCVKKHADSSELLLP